MLFLVDRIKEKWLRYYRKKVFLKRIHCKKSNVVILGKIYVQARKIIIGENVYLYPGVSIYGDGILKIGNNVQIGKNTSIYTSLKGGITIGNDVSIGANCYIIDCNHGTRLGEKIQHQSSSIGAINIGNDVWIGANSCVLKNSEIQVGAVVGAMSLVNGYIGKNGIAVGIPAKVIKERS